MHELGSEAFSNLAFRECSPNSLVRECSLVGDHEPDNSGKPCLKYKPTKTVR